MVKILQRGIMATVIIGVTCRVTIVITYIGGLVALLMTTREPPSSTIQGLGRA